MNSKKFFSSKEKKVKEEKKEHGRKHCERLNSCCLAECPIDCCSPQFLMLDKLRQGWSDVSTTGASNFPLQLKVQYNNYYPVLSDVSGTDNSGTALVTFNSVYDRTGNLVQFPGDGFIEFQYWTYDDTSGNSLNVKVQWDVTNSVYGNLINFAGVDSGPGMILYGKYYGYYYKTDVSGTNTFFVDPSGSATAITEIYNELHQGWRGMTWSEYISNQIPYSTAGVNSGGFGDDNNGSYYPPNIIPTGANVYSNTPVSSYNVIYDNALWAYLFVNTHRYSGTEACGKLDQVLGWYVNIYQSQLILLQNLPELGLETTNDLSSLSTIPVENLTPIQIKQLAELNRFYNISLCAINKVKFDPKECGNIIIVNDGCYGDWMIAINTAKSNINWADSNGEYVIVMSKLC